MRAEAIRIAAELSGLPPIELPPKLKPGTRRRYNRTYEEKRRREGSKQTSMWLTPGGQWALDQLMKARWGKRERFAKRGDAASYAMELLVRLGVTQQRRLDMGEEEIRLTSKLAAEAKVSEAQLLEIAVRWLDLCIERGVEIEA